MNKKIKIAFVRTASNHLTFGSYNIQEIGLAKALMKYCFSIDIYANFTNVSKITTLCCDNDAEIKLIPLKGFRIYKEIMYYPSLKSDLCSNNYDIVQLLDDSQMMLPYLFVSLKRCNINTILWQGMYRNFPGRAASVLQSVYDFFSKKIINNYADTKIAKTEGAKSYLLSKEYSNIKVLPVGLDDISYCDSNKYGAIVEEFSSKFNKTLLYIGAIEPRRDVCFILDVLYDLSRKDFGLIIVGKGPDVQKLKDHIELFSLQDNVLYIEQVDNTSISSLYKFSDIFLLPTKYEIYGMVLMEALKFGIPVISTPEAGPLSIIQEDYLGCCLPMDKSQWVDKILYYTSNFNTNEYCMSRNEYVKINYNWSKIGDDYYNLLCSEFSNLIQ